MLSVCPCIHAFGQDFILKRALKGQENPRESLRESLIERELNGELKRELWRELLGIMSQTDAQTTSCHLGLGVIII